LPGQQEVRWSQLKVGVLVIVALCALLALIFLISGSTGGFWSGRLSVRSYFENSAGLKIGAPVNLEGVTVGNVAAINIVPHHHLTPVEVVMKINPKYRYGIRTDSKASLETQGVLGDTDVDIDSNHATGAFVQNNAELPTTESPNLQDVIQASQGTIEKLNTILVQVNDIANSINSNKGSVGMLINDPTLYKKALYTVNQLNAIIDEVNSGKGSVGKLLKDDTMYNRLNDMVTRADRITTEIDEGKGSVGKLLKDDTLYNQLKESSQSLNQILTTINSGKGALGMMTKDPKFAAKLNDTVTHLDSVLAKMDNGEGTMGALLKDRTLYDHLDQVAQSSDQLMQAIRKDPKKYLSIKLHIF